MPVASIEASVRSYQFSPFSGAGRFGIKAGRRTVLRFGAFVRVGPRRFGGIVRGAVQNGSVPRARIKFCLLERVQFNIVCSFG